MYLKTCPLVYAYVSSKFCTTHLALDQHSDYPFHFLDSVAPDLFSDHDMDSTYDDPFEDLSGIDFDDLPPAGVVEAYIASLKDKIVHELEGNALPLCYQNGSFWIHPSDSYFGLQSSTKSSEGLAPMSLYHPRVFIWLPHLLDRQSILTCQNHECTFYKDVSHPLTFKAWNDNPIAHRVIDLKDNYYIMTQRFQCHKSGGGRTGCGKTMNLYDPMILDQIDPGLVAEFPVFLNPS